MTQADKKAEALARLDEYFNRIEFVQERDPEIMDLAEELEKVAQAEAGDLSLQGILVQWQKKEREARATVVMSSSSKRLLMPLRF